MAEWIDLLDPDEAQLREHAPRDLDPTVLERLLDPADPEGRSRPTFQGHGDYVFGVLLVAVFDPKRDRLFYQEVDLVITREAVLTVRKTPAGAKPVGHHAGRNLLADGDDIDGEIDELEGHIADWPSEQIRRRLTTIRHDLLHLRRTLAPTRDAVRGVVDGRVDIDRGMLRREGFPRRSSAPLPACSTSSCARQNRSNSRETCSRPCATTTRP